MIDAKLNGGDLKEKSKSSLIEQKKKTKKHEKNVDEKTILDIDKEDDVFTIYEDEEDNTDGKDSGKRIIITKRGKGIIVAVLSFVIFMSACFWYLEFKGHLDQFEQALYLGHYTEAQTIYNNFNSKEKRKANDMIEDKIEDVEKKYYTEENRDVDFTIREYTKISTIDYPKEDSRLNEMVDKFESLKDSEKKYKEAQEAFSKQEYEKAITKYNAVSKQDKYYKDAVAKLNDAVTEYKKEKITQADDLVKQQKFDDAIALVDKCLKLIPNEDELTKKRNKYLEEKLKVKIDDIRNEAWTSMKEEDYTKAIWVLKKAQKEYNDPKEIMDTLEEYKKKIIEKAEEYAKQGDTNAAGETINKYLLADPDDKEMQDKLKEYRPNMENVDYLSEVKINNTKGSYYVLDRTIEVFGYKNIEKGGEFSISTKDYNRIRGMISYSDEKTVASGHGKLIIKSGANTIKEYSVEKKDKCIQLDIDISDYKNITFEWCMADSDNENTYAIELENIKLYKD